MRLCLKPRMQLIALQQFGPKLQLIAIGCNHVPNAVGKSPIKTHGRQLGVHFLGNCFALSLALLFFLYWRIRPSCPRRVRLPYPTMFTTPLLSQSARHKEAPIKSDPARALREVVRTPARLKIRSGSSDMQGIEMISRAICDKRGHTARLLSQ